MTDINIYVNNKIFKEGLPLLTLCIKQCRLQNSKKQHMIQKTYLKTKDICKVKFTINAENAETIEILGLNSDWENSVVMSKKKDGSFNCEVSLPKGSQHEFKYKVNATEWANEPEADSQQPNEFGGINSVLVI